MEKANDRKRQKKTMIRGSDMMNFKKFGDLIIKILTHPITGKVVEMMLEQKKGAGKHGNK